MYIVGSGTVLHAVADEPVKLDKALAELSPVKLRRADKFIQLSLVGALRCAKGHRIPQSASMTLAMSVGTISTSLKMMETMFVKGNSPKPFQFVNSLGNSACYFLSKHLGIMGASVAISQENFSFEAALRHAKMEMALNESGCVLIGGTDEAPLPVSDQLLRLRLENEAYEACFEGSHWLLVSSSSEGAKARVSDSVYIDMEDTAEVVFPLSGCSAAYLNFVPDEAFKASLERGCQLVYPEEGVCPHGVYSGHNMVLASEFLDQTQNKKVAVVSRDLRINRYTVTILESVN